MVAVCWLWVEVMDGLTVCWVFVGVLVGGLWAIEDGFD